MILVEYLCVSEKDEKEVGSAWSVYYKLSMHCVEDACKESHNTCQCHIIESMEYVQMYWWYKLQTWWVTLRSRQQYISFFAVNYFLFWFMISSLVISLDSIFRIFNQLNKICNMYLNLKKAVLSIPHRCLWSSTQQKLSIYLDYLRHHTGV